MFGNCPKALWSQWVEADSQNRIPLACRALLIRDDRHVILVESGIGAYMEPKLRERFGVMEPNHVLLDSLLRIGTLPEHITHVILSHLHFDHAGGILSSWNARQPPHLLFPNATFLVGHDAFARAESPHARDRASFIPGLTELLRASGRLELVTGPTTSVLSPRYRFRFSEGHTPGLMHLEILDPIHLVFASDLIPGRPWVHIPITMGYDRYPEQLIDEKTALLEDLVKSGGYLFYTHDARCAASRVARDERGKYGPVEELAQMAFKIP